MYGVYLYDALSWYKKRWRDYRRRSIDMANARLDILKTQKELSLL